MQTTLYFLAIAAYHQASHTAVRLGDVSLSITLFVLRPHHLESYDVNKLLESGNKI